MQRRKIWPFLLYSGWALGLTWPLLLHLTAGLPLGSERSATVPQLNLWTLGWNVNRLVGGDGGYWDAPIFYPALKPFAYSEPQPLSGLLATPVWFIDPALAYNGVLLLFLILNGLLAYRLFRRLELGQIPALLGGLVVQSLPFLSHERGVLQLVPIFGVLLALEGLWSVRERPDWRAGLRLGLGVGITFLTSENYALFLGLLLLPAIIFLLPSFRRRRAWWALLVAAGLALILTLPLALPQGAALREMGFSRGIATITSGSAEVADYLRPSSAIWAREWFPVELAGNQRLYPGFVLFISGVAGLMIGLRQPRYRRWALYLGLAALLAFVVSLGFNLSIAGWQPYTLVWEYLPGFDNLRSPFRMGHFVQVYLVLLAVFALDQLDRSRYRIVAFGLVVLMLVEFFPKPARITPVPEELDWSTVAGPALVLPFPDEGATAAFVQTTAWMVGNLPEAVPLVNGYSGYFPRFQRQLRDLLADFPSPGGLAAARDLGVKTLLIQSGTLTPEQQARLEDYLRDGKLASLPAVGEFQAFEVRDSRLNMAASYHGEWALEHEVTADSIDLRLYAAVPDDQMYLSAPGVAPLKWRAQLTGPADEISTHTVRPQDAVLLYHGSDRWLSLSIPRPDQPGRYILMLVDAASGQVIAEGELEVP